MTERQARDEGAAQTALIMEAVKRARSAKGWSAAQLADEMTAAGIPWNRSVVENLEYGRRKSLRVHELVALAYILDVNGLLDLLVPDQAGHPYPVTPHLLLSAAIVQSWARGETGPLREWQASRKTDPDQLAAMIAELPAEARRQIEDLARRGLRAGWTMAGNPEDEDPDATYFDAKGTNGQG